MKINQIIKRGKHSYIVDTIYANRGIDAYRLNKRKKPINKLCKFKIQKSEAT